jgi:hypothetical protein
VRSDGRRRRSVTKVGPVIIESASSSPLVVF